MDDFSTRPSHTRRQGSATSAAVLAAAFFVTLAGLSALPQLARSASGPETTGSLPLQETARPTPLSMAIQVVAPGSEGLELSARMTEESSTILRDIAWTIRDSAGMTVFEGLTPLADAVLPPGDYRIEGAYGSVRIAEAVTLLAGNRVALSFVLDVGALRILPRVKGLGPSAAASKSLVYAASGIDAGKLITISETPGEVLRVSAGDYRVESQFPLGNATASTLVKVKPGIMSAIEIDHLAGLARLAFVGAPGSAVSWKITPDQGEALPPIAGLNAQVVLKPGRYVAEAHVGTETLSARFEIGVGQERDIMLGN